MTDQEMINRLQKDKEMMYESNKELKDENDYLKTLIGRIKEVVGSETDGYEIVLKVMDLKRGR